jgi:hypothetical protein
MDSFETVADAAWDCWIVKFLVFHYSNSNQKQMITNKIVAMAENSNNSRSNKENDKMNQCLVLI